MQIRQFNELAAARRGHTFLTTTPPAPPVAALPAQATQQVQTLGTTISQIDAQASVQTAAVGAITDTASAATEAAKELRTGHLVPLKKVARLVAKGSTGAPLSPNFPEAITIPRSRHYDGLLTAATAAVQTVTPYKDLFIARGLPTDFLDQLNTQATALSQAMQACGVAKTTRVSTTKDLKQLMSELRSTMHVLELAMTKACKADRLTGPTTFTAWKNARTIRKTATPTDIPFTPPTAAPAASASPPAGTSTRTPAGTSAQTSTDTASSAVSNVSTSATPGASHV